MIQIFNKKDKNLRIELSYFLSNNFDYDFYITKENTRYYINECTELFLKECEPILFSECEGEINGVLGIWNGVGQDIKRHYIKLCTVDCKVAKSLLTVLLWNYGFKNLFLKLRRDSKFFETFREKSFRFKGSHGSQILLHKRNSLNYHQIMNYQKEKLSE